MKFQEAFSASLILPLLKPGNPRCSFLVLSWVVESLFVLRASAVLQGSSAGVCIYRQMTSPLTPGRQYSSEVVYCLGMFDIQAFNLQIVSEDTDLSNHKTWDHYLKVQTQGSFIWLLKRPNILWSSSSELCLLQLLAVSHLGSTDLSTARKASYSKEGSSTNHGVAK